jgi:membrane protease YdiL (CAAX protease family)
MTGSTELASATAVPGYTDPATARRAVVETPSPDQLRPARLLVLFLVPGALMTLAFVAMAPVVEAIGLPPIAALLAAIVGVLVPIELGVVLWASRGTDGRLAAVPYRSPMPLRTWIWIVPVLIVAAFVGFGLHQVIEPQLIDRLFGWLPGWFVTPIPLDQVGAYSRVAWIVTFGAFLAINGFLGPIVEELYFRGYLLPRMEYMGRWGPLVNVTLFSLYHFWSPWQIAARILGFGPTVYAVRWKRNVYLGMVVHCSLNTLAVLLVAALVFGRV